MRLHVLNNVQEVNRVRKQAITLGFHEFLDSLAAVLENEMVSLNAANNEGVSTVLFHIYCNRTGKINILNTEYFVSMNYCHCYRKLLLKLVCIN